MNSSPQIRLGALMSYLAIAFNVVAGLLYTPWMIQEIGQADYGLYALAMSIMAYFMMDFGIGSAVGRFIAKYRAEGQEQRANQLLGLAAKLFLLFDFLFLVVIVTLYFFLETIFGSFTAGEIDKFNVVFCIVGLFSVVKFPFLVLNGIFIGFERFVFLKFSDLLRKIFTVAMMVGALSLGYGLYALVIVNALIGILIIIVQCIYVFMKTPVRIELGFFDLKLLKEIFAYSAWITVILFAQRLYINIAPTILGIFSGTEEIAVFSIGMTIEGYFYTFASALGGLFLAKVSRILAGNDPKAVDDLLLRIGRLQMIIIGAILISFITIGKEFIILWVGPEFERSYSVSLFLMAPGVVFLTQQIAYTMLQAQNKVKYQAISLLCASPLSLGLSVWLSRYYGAIGASIGICVGLLLCHVAMSIIFHRVFDLDISRFFAQCHLKILPSFLLALGAGFLIARYVPAESLLLFMPKALLLVVLYSSIVWMFAMNRYEKNLVLSFLKKGR